MALMMLQYNWSYTSLNDYFFITKTNIFAFKCNPVIIVGDIHDQLYDLVRIFKSENASNDDKSYLFFSNYVDRRHNILSTFLLLLTYKLRYPNHVFILRWNHEDEAISKSYGFRDRLKWYHNLL